MLASIGIVVGIAAFTFFLALGAGVKSVVLGQIFPLDRLEVENKTMDLDLGPLRMGMGKDTLDEEAVQQIRAIPNVEAVYPKMKLTVASTAAGGESLFGNKLRSELLVDGIEPTLVEEDIAPGHEFADFEASESPPRSCESDTDCGSESLYCDDLTKGAPKVCRPYVPVIASTHLIEMYNGVLRRAHDFPRLNPEFLIGFTFDLAIGNSMVKASRKDQIVRRRAKLVGFSDKAIPLGITLPIGYVKRFNVAYGSDTAATTYHSAVVMIDSKDDVAAVAKAVQELGYEVTDHGAEQAAMLIVIIMMVFGLVSSIIVGIAAVNIMHVFFMLIYERQKEIGIMRAVGASRGDIRAIILGEAALVGLIAGVLGIAVAFGSSLIADAVSASYIPDFPYKPDTYFHFGPTLLLGALACAVAFCVLGAFLPARRAARMDPAAVLTGH
jgi:ABC-type antimicrobial peptide transport system permease subunit